MTCGIHNEVDFGTDGIIDLDLFSDMTEDEFENLADILFKECCAASSVGELDFS